jgi:hypothetical protein
MRNVQELQAQREVVQRLVDDNAAMMNDVMRLVQRMQNNVNVINMELQYELACAEIVAANQNQEVVA